MIREIETYFSCSNSVYLIHYIKSAVLCTAGKETLSGGRMSAVNKSKEDEGTFSTKVIKIVFIILLLDLLGFTLILPLLPSILDHYAESGVGLFFLKFFLFFIAV